MGQQATFTNASRLFVLSVRNREANRARPGNSCRRPRSLMLPIADVRLIL